MAVESSVTAGLTWSVSEPFTDWFAESRTVTFTVKNPVAVAVQLKDNGGTLVQLPGNPVSVSVNGGTPPEATTVTLSGLPTIAGLGTML